MNETHGFSDRDLRQRDILPSDRLADCSATVIGVGAIGRQVALQLAAIGIPRLQLIDHDTVEPVNLAAQGYLERDVGRPKVEATGELCKALNSGIELRLHPERFRRSMLIGNIDFCCVDSIETRRLIWNAIGQTAEFFCDGRMAAETLRVVTASDMESRGYYPTTLFAPGEAHRGACTARSTIYCANVAAGLMLAQFAKFLRRLPIDPDIQFNLLTTELSIRSQLVALTS